MPKGALNGVISGCELLGIGCAPSPAIQNAKSYRQSQREKLDSKHKNPQRKQDGRNDNTNLSEQIRKTKVAYFFLSNTNKNRHDADKRKENPNMHSEMRKQIH